MYKLRFIYMLFLILFAVVILTVAPLLLLLKTQGLEPELITERVLIITFYSLIFAFLISLFFSRSITKPLNILKKASARVRAGELDFEIPQRDRIDEFSDLVKTFNHMLKGLKEKTEELKKKEAYIELMTDPLIVTDEDGRVIDMNPAFTRLLGYERSEALELNINKVFPHLFREPNLSIKDLKSWPEETKAISKNGEEIPVLISPTPIKFNGSSRLVITMKDFREGLKLREEIRLSRDYLESVMNSIQDELLVIDKDFRVIKANHAVIKRIGSNPEGRFCYMISHLLERPCEEIQKLDCPVQVVFTTKRPFVTEHEHFDSEGRSRTYEVIAYPVIENGEVINVIEFARDMTDKKQLEKELIRRNKNLSLLNEIAAILAKSLRADEIFYSVLEKLKETFGMDGGGIFIIDRETLICRYHSGVSEEFVRQAGRLPLGHDIPGRIAQSGMGITSLDVSRDPRLERSMLKHSGIRGYCCIPLKGKERIHGVFCLFSFKPFHWTMDDEEVLRAAGEMMGLAFENITLYEKVQGLYRALKDKRQKELENLSIMVDMLSGTRRLNELLDASLLFIKERLNPDLVGLVKIDQTGNLILRKVLPQLKELNEPYLLYKENVSSQESLSIKESVIIQVKDIRQEPRFYYNEIFKKDFNSCLTIPLTTGEKNTGCLSLYSRTPRDFTEEEIHFLKIFSTVLALSIERSEFYENILKQEALSTTILDSIEDGVYTVDRNGYITSINKAAEEILYIRRERILGRKCSEIILHGAERKLCGTDECPLSIALRGGSSSTEIEYLNPKGRRFILQVNCLPLKDPVTGEVTGALQVFRDITGQKELDRMKTEIIRSVSHEFRTPLTAIIGMTEMILNGDVTGERAREYLGIMYREGLRLSKMISELLDISRLEKREFFKVGPVEIKKIIESIKEGFSDIIEKKEGFIAIKVEGDVSNFTGDQDKIEQMLRNLIDNSLTYSDPGVRISLIIKKVDDMLEITVKDTGWGIPEEDIPHLGEKFYRGTHGEKTKGTGLGLSLVKEIVKLHGGTLSIESKVGKGTSVQIKLPFQRQVE